MIYENSEFYQGEWIDGKRHGEGMHVVPFKSCKQGIWIKDVYRGKSRPNVNPDSALDFIDDMDKTLPRCESSSADSEISVYNTRSFHPMPADKNYSKSSFSQKTFQKN